jgi:hypothetical protein
MAVMKKATPHPGRAALLPFAIAALLLLATGGGVAAGPASPIPVLFQVTSPVRPILDPLAPVVEGRLLTRLKGQEQFALVVGQGAGEYRLLLELTDLRFTQQGQVQQGFDAASDPSRPEYKINIGGELDFDVTLTRVSDGREVYGASTTVTTSRSVDNYDESVKSQLIDDMVERMSDKVLKLLKKHLRK